MRHGGRAGNQHLGVLLVPLGMSKQEVDSSPRTLGACSREHVARHMMRCLGRSHRPQAGPPPHRLVPVSQVDLEVVGHHPDLVADLHACSRTDEQMGWSKTREQNLDQKGHQECHSRPMCCTCSSSTLAWPEGGRDTQGQPWTDPVAP